MAKSTKIRYDVHPSVAMVQKWTAELPAKTGKTLEEWAEIVRDAKLETLTERRDFLKSQYKHGTNSAWWIAEYAYSRATWDGDESTYLKNAELFVDAMYTGAKCGLKPIYEKLICIARSLGKDVRICPCKTMVPFYRSRVFAEVKPSTKTRIDISLALSLELPESAVLKRHEQRIKQKDRMSHRIAISTLAEVNDEVERWIREAYESDEE